MRVVLNYRRPNERLEYALGELGHDWVYHLWDIRNIEAQGADAVLFEFKQIVKEELRFAALSLRLRKCGIPTATWCLDNPNIGSRMWKLHAIAKYRLVDVLATHSLQGLEGYGNVLYLPNAAMTQHYNLGVHTLEEMRDPGFCTVDVSFIGNFDGERYPEHRERMRLLGALEGILRKLGRSCRFVGGDSMDYGAQTDLIRRSRINMNVGCAADRYDRRSWGLPERCYGIPACGGFLLSDDREHAKDDFAIGEEIDLFRELPDCVEKIRHYLDAHEESRRIAENAYARVHREHTYRHRVARLLGALMRATDGYSGGRGKTS
jgi:spore maturation protein CgeB